MFKIIDFIGGDKLIVLQVTGVQLMGMIHRVGVEVEQFKILVERFCFRVAQHTAQRFEFLGSVVHPGGMEQFIAGL